MGAGTGASATGAGKAPGSTCRHASQVKIECIDCTEKVAIAYIHDHSPGGLPPLERLAQVQAQLANLQVALPASRHHKSRSNASTGWLLHICMISLYIYIYNHSPAGLRPLEPLAWAQAQVLRPQGLAELHVALPAGITSRDRRYQLYVKGGYRIYA